MLGFSTLMINLYLTQLYLGVILFFIDFAIFISIVVNKQKRGWHDQMVNVVIANLKTMIPLTEAEMRFKQIMGVYPPPLHDSQLPPQQNFNDIEFNKDVSQQNKDEVSDIKLATSEQDLKENVRDSENGNVNKEKSFETKNSAKSEYDKLTIDELKELAEQKELIYSSDMTKQDLINLLEQNK